VFVFVFVFVFVYLRVEQANGKQFSKRAPRNSMTISIMKREIRRLKYKTTELKDGNPNKNWSGITMARVV